MAQNIFGRKAAPRCPSATSAKPLIVALLALLASRYFGVKNQETAPEMPKLPDPAPQSLPIRRPATSSTGSAASSAVSAEGTGDVSSDPGSAPQEQKRGPDQISISWRSAETLSMICRAGPG